MNLMHENLQVTDGVYGIFSKIDINRKITALGNDANNGYTKKEVVKLIEEALEEIRVKNC